MRMIIASLIVAGSLASCDASPEATAPQQESAGATEGVEYGSGPSETMPATAPERPAERQDEAAQVPR